MKGSDDPEERGKVRQSKGATALRAAARGVSFPHRQSDAAALENSALKCQTCGTSFTIPADRAPGELIKEESVRCARLREIAQRRQTLSLKVQAGIVGMLGSDSVDTIDLVAHRRSLAQLDATLANEAKDLEAAMLHKPDWL